MSKNFVPLLLLVLALVPACVGKRQPLERFAESQRRQMAEDDAYIQADFDFWASVYKPTLDDLQRLRAAWVEHAGAFPESKTFEKVERAVRDARDQVVLVALFSSEYQDADLNDESKGWTVSPAPRDVDELSETDVVLRTLMPVNNLWARYFLLRYGPNEGIDGTDFVVSNRTSTVKLRR